MRRSLRRSPAVTATPGASATPAGGACVCGLLRGRVADAVINDALANPGRYHGWNALREPRRPEGLFNPRRTCLSLERTAVPYHPLFNSLEWHAGCP